MAKRIPYYKPTMGTPVRARAKVGDPFYWSTRWRKFRSQVLREQPLCEDCLAHDELTEATEVHHIKKRVDRPDLAFVRANVKSLCKRCHSKRTGLGE
jgi:5-methylcytosine-specific restriction enzyme A